MRKVICTTQGLYYLATGVWPVVHINSFILVTGPKTDIWLVKMVALLTISVGITILVMSRARTQFMVLNYTTAMSFLIIDTYYSLTGRISPIYLADAALEVLLIILLASTGPRTNSK
ncbi:MAG TPA: hypothetical protein VJ720_01210 [Chitinophaga sp.]|nr:hypothetical protein [Chitinophaga sp.]